MSTSSQAQSDREPGRPEIPEHSLLRCIGGGSYGEVWLARTVHGQFRAVKVVHRSWFQEDERPFEREYEGLRHFDAVSRSHASQLPVLQIGRNEEAGYFYYVMEPADDVMTGQVVEPETYAPKTLSRVLKDRGRLPLAELLPVALALTDALEHLHRSQLVHRDIKPSNIVWHHGVPKLADIGLVTAAGERGTLVGTTGYFPDGGVVDASGDLFSLGKVLYQAATGLKPEFFPRFPDDLPNDAARDDMRELNEILLRACAPEPADRYRSAAEFRQDLQALRAGQSLWARRRRRRQFALAAGIVCLGLSVGLAVQHFRTAPQSRGVSQPAPSELTHGLIHWWKGDGDTRDAVGGAHGTMLAGGGFVPGRVGRGFAGVVEIPDQATLNFPADQPFTIALWAFSTNATLQPQHLLGKRDEFSLAYQFAIDGRGLTFGPGGWAGASVSSQVLPERRWTHLAATSDGKGVTTLLVNGVALATGPGVYAIRNPSPLKLGGAGPYRPFAGYLDDVRVYHRALTADEVKSLIRSIEPEQESRPARSLPPPPGLVHWWPGEGDARDVIGSAHGTMPSRAGFAPGQVGRAFSGPVVISGGLVVSFDRNAPMTVELWVQPTNSGPSSGHIIGKRVGCDAPSPSTFQLATDGRGELHFSASLGIRLNAARGGLPRGAWTHLGLTFDGTMLSLYMNGELSAARAQPLGPTNNAPLIIGGSGDCPPFTGLTDEVSIYNRALTADEIRAIHGAGPAGKKFPTDLRGGQPTLAAGRQMPVRATNSLGMVFVPVPGTDVQFCIWHTRVQDFEAFALATGRTVPRVAFSQEKTHPCVYVSWEDSQAFCQWLTSRERAAGTLPAWMRYRLPMDWEWSAAVGLVEPRGGLPADKHLRATNAYPWGSQWPPPGGVANYAELLGTDSFPKTSPVGSFPPNAHGLFDLGGNAWQWCEDPFDRSLTNRVLRGGSWHNDYAKMLNSSYRHVQLPDRRDASYGSQRERQKQTERRQKRPKHGGLRRSWQWELAGQSESVFKKVEKGQLAAGLNRHVMTRAA